MTKDLYRKEALDHVTQRLYGEVIMKSPPASWIITFIVIFVFLLFFGILCLASVDVDGVKMSLIEWLLSRTG